jgi:genome maintenance exonuclease 1
MTLLNPKFNYKPLARDESTGKRLYATPEGHKVPSVTTVLDKTKPAEAREALARWKKAVGEQKAQEIVTEAAGRGTRMHKFLEDYIKGTALRESVTNPYAQQSLDMARVVIKEGFPKISEVWGSEVPLYFPELYAGTTDCVGIHEDQEAILDFKHGTNIRKGVILMCSKDYEYQEFVLEPKDFDYWTDRWCDRVSEYYRLSA